MDTIESWRISRDVYYPLIVKSDILFNSKIDISTDGKKLFLYKDDKKEMDIPLGLGYIQELRSGESEEISVLTISEKEIDYIKGI